MPRDQRKINAAMMVELRNWMEVGASGIRDTTAVYTDFMVLVK